MFQIDTQSNNNYTQITNENTQNIKIKRTTTLTLFKDTGDKLRELREKYNFPSLDLTIRALMYAFNTLMCIELVNTLAVMKKTILSEKELEDLLEKYPECDPIELGIVEKIQHRKTREIKYHVLTTDITQLMKPLRIYIELSRKEHSKKTVEAVVRQLYYNKYGAILKPKKLKP